MSSLTFYLLGCLMFVTTVSSRKMPVPAHVNHPDEQCRLRGFLGFCTNLPTPHAYVDCQNIECAAALRGKATSHRAMSIGLAARGTHCDVDKICWDGECINIPRGIHMPEEFNELEEGFVCFRPNSGKPSSGHSG